MYVTVRLEPMQVAKPRIALDAAADVARRIGCHVAVEVNGTTVRIAPTTPKAMAFEHWSAAKAGTGPAERPGGENEQAGA
jgi:hypothetical protein